MIKAQSLAKFLYNSLQANPSEADKIMKYFLEFVDEKKLIALLPRVVIFLAKFQKSAMNAKTLKITLQQEHSKSVIDVIKQKVNSPASTPTQVIIDDKIKGGFIASFNDVIYDASVATQLENARRKLTS